MERIPGRGGDALGRFQERQSLEIASGGTHQYGDRVCCFGPLESVAFRVLVSEKTVDGDHRVARPARVLPRAGQAAKKTKTELGLIKAPVEGSLQVVVKMFDLVDDRVGVEDPPPGVEPLEPPQGMGSTKLGQLMGSSCPAEPVGPQRLK